MKIEWMVLTKDTATFEEGSRRIWYQAYKGDDAEVATRAYWDVADAYGQKNALIFMIGGPAPPRFEE